MLHLKVDLSCPADTDKSSKLQKTYITISPNGFLATNLDIPLFVYFTESFCA